MPSPELITSGGTFTALSATQFYTIADNADVGPLRMKSLHIDFAISPNATADRPVIVDFVLHRHHRDLSTADLASTEGTRVKFERVTVGRTTDRYYRMWLKQINLENGYELTCAIVPVLITGGTPSGGAGWKFWQLTVD